MPNPVFKSITDSFANAEIYEREIMDLLGATVEGLAPSFRYPLTDDWPSDQFPLRKSWKQEGAKIVGA
jgi:Ni,Fe-hydrogenase III component G